VVSVGGKKKKKNRVKEIGRAEGEVCNANREVGEASSRRWHMPGNVKGGAGRDLGKMCLRWKE
jgi:hypothetical protein